MTTSGDGIATSELAFVIYPETELASVDLLLNALDHIRRLLRDVDYAIYGGKFRPRWDVRSLHSSAPTITVKPGLLDERQPSSVHEICEGLRKVTSGIDYPPQFFTERALLNLKAMRRLFRGKDRAKSIVVLADGEQVASIGRDISTIADRILGSGYRNLGSLEGTLEAINVHGSPIVTVWDRVHGTPVRCSIPKEGEWLARVKEFLGNRVLVTGNVHYFVNGTPRSIDSVTALEDATPDCNLPKAEFGSIPDPRAAADPASFLQSIREPATG